MKINQKLRDNLDINLDTRYSDMRTMGDEGTTNGSGSLLSSSSRFRPIATRDILGDLNALREGNMAVSYTHLDVYKRQVLMLLTPIMEVIPLSGAMTR